MKTPKERLSLITRNTAEVLTSEELHPLLDSGEPIRHYIGFEISGKVHLGTGLVVMGKIKDFMDAGIECSIWLADWHTWINDKLGGDREVIKRVATGYFAEAMKASLACLGGDPDKLTFRLSTDVYHNNDDFWATVIDVSKNTSLARMQRSITILGRGEGDSVDFAKLIYPAMQVADVFTLNVHIAHSGMDQRKAHVIARDVGDRIHVNALHNARGEQIKPIAVHHALLLGLRKPPVWPVPEDRIHDVLTSMKMSKSDPGAAVFVHDDPDTIRAKIGKAFCPPGNTTFNPVLNWLQNLVFSQLDGELRIERSERDGGAVSFATYDDLAKAYANEKLHPMDAKAALTNYLIDLLEPVRTRFAQPEMQAHLAELEAALK